MHDFHSEDEQKHILAHMRSQMKAIFGVDDTSGVELFSTIRRLAYLSEALECQFPEDLELSGPRWRLMLHLLADENLGGAGLNPTAISQRQRVSKNTISALLRGLEEQGLIQRELDPRDYRTFRIRLTPAGRDLIHTTAPQRLAHMNELAAGLSTEERDQLITLLDKLHHFLLNRQCEISHPSNSESHGG